MNLDIQEVKDKGGSVLGTLVLCAIGKRTEDYLFYGVEGHEPEALKEIFLNDCVGEFPCIYLIDDLNEKYNLGCTGIKSNYIGIDLKR